LNIAFVPVRGGSKSIPDKNIKDFCGKPLVYWCLSELDKSRKIDKIIVATDSIKIKKIVLKFNIEKVTVFDRSNENASDSASTESVLLEFLNNSKFQPNDFIVLTQATSPLTISSDIDGALEKLITKGGDSLVSCVRYKRFFWSDEGRPLNYDYRNRPRRQDFDGLLMENGAFYINSVANILKYKTRISGKVLSYEMDDFKYIEIDEEHDWHIAEKLMKSHLKTSNTSKKIIKLFISDVDGTLTDAGMYYGNNGEELKKFNTHDGKGFELLRNKGVKTAIITSENTKIVKDRAEKLKVDYLFQGCKHMEKLNVARSICEKERISIEQVAYIGDDINCVELLQNVGLCACPSNAVEEVYKIEKILKLRKSGGNGAVREFIDLIICDS